MNLISSSAAKPQSLPRFLLALAWRLAGGTFMAWLALHNVSGGDAQRVTGTDSSAALWFVVAMQFFVAMIFFGQVWLCVSERLRRPNDQGVE